MSQDDNKRRAASAALSYIKDGTAIGVGFSMALIKATESEGIDKLAIPTQSLIGIAVFAAVAAVVAAALPARRAAKLDVLDAISG